MGQVINVAVQNKIAKNLREKESEYVCGNSDFVVEFDFDAEWDAFDAKTARFKYNGTHQDIVFTGNRVSIPIISNTYKIELGVFAGDLHTTTPATIIAKKSILCGGGLPEDPTPDVYAQIMELLSQGSGGNPDYGAENAGKLLYVGSDGKATVLALGAGLAIVDGMLTITSQVVTSAICGQAVCGNAICGGA